MTRLCNLIALSIFLAFSSASISTAKEPLTYLNGFPVFQNYETFRAYLDPLIKKRQVVKFLDQFGGNARYTKPQALQIEEQIRGLRKVDMQHVEVIRTEDLSDNWTQEMLAHWTGADYIFLYVLYQNRDEGLFAINVTFNTDIKPLLQLMM